MIDKPKAIELRKNGFSYKEISKIVGCSTSWCKTHLGDVLVESGPQKMESDSLYVTKFNGCMKIIKDYGWDKVLVEFLDTKTRTYARRSDIISGTVKDYYYPSVFGVGYIGIGEYTNRVDGRTTGISTAWRGALRRCYDRKYVDNHPTYLNCTISDDWHNFQVFAKWASSQKNGNGWHLDQDILVRGNKHYSETSCCFVPSKINSLLAYTKSTNSGLPIGVVKVLDRYYAYCGNKNEQKYLGASDTATGAFMIYKEGKEAAIKTAAEEYSSKIEHNVYKALMGYEVHYAKN